MAGDSSLRPVSAWRRQAPGHRCYPMSFARRSRQPKPPSKPTAASNVAAAYAPAPCSVACPADIDVSGFVADIARGDAKRAARTIFAENLLGGTCARVCPVEILCEGSCVLSSQGERPIAIGQLQRHATDRALCDGMVLRDRAAASTGRRVAVIGAGPAGLVAAGELALLGHEVVIYDERDEPGGLVRFAIAPFRQLVEPLPEEIAQIEAIGVELRLGEAIASHERLDEISEASDVVLLAVGMGADTDVDLPGDDLAGVYESLPFIEALKTGAPMAVGGRVVIVGGGNTAVDCAREARRLGAEVVTLAYRRGEEEMPAFAHEVAEASDEGVEFRWFASPVRFVGNSALEAVECVEMRPGPIDASGRRRPEPVPGSAFAITADTAILAIGQRPRTEILSWIEGLELDRGRVVVDPATGATGNPRFYAAGDVVSGGSIAVEAVRQAKLTARAIDASFEVSQ